MPGILCKCGIWNDYLDLNQAFEQGYDIHCRNCGKVIWDYKKQRRLEIAYCRESKERVRREREDELYWEEIRGLVVAIKERAITLIEVTNVSNREKVHVTDLIFEIEGFIELIKKESEGQK